MGGYGALVWIHLVTLREVLYQNDQVEEDAVWDSYNGATSECISSLIRLYQMDEAAPLKELIFDTVSKLTRASYCAFSRPLDAMVNENVLTAKYKVIQDLFGHLFHPNCAIATQVHKLSEAH